jgi:hypothetical protein
VVSAIDHLSPKIGDENIDVIGVDRHCETRRCRGAGGR